METPSKKTVIANLFGLHQRVFKMLDDVIGRDVLPLLARLTLAGIFWRSVLLKVEVTKLFPYTEYINDFAIEKFHVRLPELPLSLKSSTLHQFNNDFSLPLLPGDMAAWMATLEEFTFPILLVLGVFTRLSALGLLAMTLVIQVFIFPEAWWGMHAMWATIAIYIAVTGPGRVSVDFWAARIFAR